jgi:NADH:ubiquinone oxidoreductase subunit 4 (subunit M)
MVTNLVTLKSIGEGQFVRVRGIRVVASDNSGFSVNHLPLHCHIAISALIIGTIWLGVYPQPILNALKR